MYFLGRDINLICPPDFYTTVVDTVKAGVSGRVASIFVAGFVRPVVDSLPVSTSPPTDVERRNFLVELSKDCGPNKEDKINNLVQKYVAYTEYCGDASPLSTAIIKICYILIRVDEEWRQWAANLAQRLVLEGLKWEGGNERLWELWSQSLIRAGRPDDSERIDWEALRRFPLSESVGCHLVKVIRLQGRIDEALRLARRFFSIFPENPHLTIQLAGLLIERDHILEAVDVLSNNLHVGFNTKILSFLAYILSNADRVGPLSDGILDIVVKKFRNGPELSVIGRKLVGEHKNFIVAQRLWHRRIADTAGVDDFKSWCQLAMSYAKSGAVGDLAKAVKILRDAKSKFPDPPDVDNQLALVLALT